jgi:hypothetical protein
MTTKRSQIQAFMHALHWGVGVPHANEKIIVEAAHDNPNKDIQSLVSAIAAPLGTSQVSFLRSTETDPLLWITRAKFRGGENGVAIKDMLAKGVEVQRAIVNPAEHPTDSDVVGICLLLNVPVVRRKRVFANGVPYMVQLTSLCAI